MINIIACSIAIILGLCLCIYPCINNKKEDVFSFRNTFVCEVYQDKYHSYIFYSILSLLFVGFACFGFISDSFLTYNANGIIYLIARIISILAVLGIVLFRLDNYKQNIICSLILILCSTGSEIQLAIDKTINLVVSSGNIYINLYAIFAIIMGVVGIVKLILLFLPSVRNWNKMDKSEENGKVIYVRPKFNGLAFLQWFNIFSIIFDLLLVLIANVVNLL